MNNTNKIKIKGKLGRTSDTYASLWFHVDLEIEYPPSTTVVLNMEKLLEAGLEVVK